MVECKNCGTVFADEEVPEQNIKQEEVELLFFIALLWYYLYRF